MKKTNAVIGVLLVAALLFAPHQSKAQAKKSDEKVIGPIVCAVIIVGGVVVIGLYKLCQNVLPTSDPAPAPPVEPQAIIQSSKDGAIIGLILSLMDNSSVRDISSNAVPDLQSKVAGATYQTMVTYTLESSTNLHQWATELRATGWVSDYGIFFAYYRGGSNVINTYSARGVTNYVPVDIGSLREGSKYFRMVP